MAIFAGLASNGAWVSAQCTRYEASNRRFVSLLLFVGIAELPECSIRSSGTSCRFNLAESWIFAVLPALWKDKRRIARPLLFILWLTLGINLTNAFLAPYLLLTELRTDSSSLPERRKNRIVSAVFGSIATAVIGYALYQGVRAVSVKDWMKFAELARTGRTYLAFCIDIVLFSVFQPLLLGRINGKTRPIDCVPFVGLIAWLFRSDE